MHFDYLRKNGYFDKNRTKFAYDYAKQKRKIIINLKNQEKVIRKITKNNLITQKLILPKNKQGKGGLSAEKIAKGKNRWIIPPT